MYQFQSTVKNLFVTNLLINKDAHKYSHKDNLTFKLSLYNIHFLRKNEDL